jgi:hypothetical protein
MPRTSLFINWSFLYSGTITLVSAQSLRDIKPSVDFSPDYYLWWVIGISLFLLVLLIWLVKWFLKKYSLKNLSGQSQEELSINFHEQALKALRKLRKKDLPSCGRVKEYYRELSIIVRYYLEDRFGLRAPEMTSEEFFCVFAHSNDLTGLQKNLLKNFLQHCDLVKFSEFRPSKEEIEESFHVAQKLISESFPKDRQTERRKR